MNADSNHSYKWINGMIQASQVEIRLINIGQAKEFLLRIPIARVKFSNLSILNLFFWLETRTYIAYQSWIYNISNQMKKLNKKYADLLHQASLATGRKEAVGLLHKAAKLQIKFDEKSKF